MNTTGTVSKPAGSMPSLLHRPATGLAPTLRLPALPALPGSISRDFSPEVDRQLA